MWSVRHSQANKGMCAGFEEHVRCLMATGATARAIREGLFLNATHYLSPSEAAVYCGQVPKLDWFIKLKNGQEMDIDKDDSIRYHRQARKRRTQRVTIVYHDKSNTLHISLARRTHTS